MLNFLFCVQLSLKYLDSVCKFKFKLGILIPGFLPNQISVVEKLFETCFRFYWPSEKFKFKAQLNLVICIISLLAIPDRLMKTFVNTQH